MYVKYYLVNLFVSIYLINSQYYQILLNTKKSSCINCKIFYVTGNIVPLNRWRIGMSSRTDGALLWVQFQTGPQNEFKTSWDCHLVWHSEFCLASDDSDFKGSLCDTLSSRPDSSALRFQSHLGQMWFQEWTSGVKTHLGCQWAEKCTLAAQ
jgi:hypothetical protein